MKFILPFLLALFLQLALSLQTQTTGVPVAYQLPNDGPLPRTYCVTLAITDLKNPDWIIGALLAAQPGW